MVLVWKGKGIYVLMFFGILMYLYFLIFVKDPNAKVFNSHAVATSSLLTGIICFFLSNRWKRNEGKKYFDTKKNKQVIIRPDHSFFYINVYYWSYILTILGLIIFYANFS